MNSIDKKFEDWFKKNYIYFFLIFDSFFVFLPLSAPVLLNAGFSNISKLLYDVFGFFCHQLPYRSWFLYGRQTFYPLNAAGINNRFNFETFSNIPIHDHVSLSQFLGNTTMGYKLAICQRDLAMYSGFLIFGLVFSFLKQKIKPISIWIWILFGLLPLAVDGIMQLLSEFDFPLFQNLVYESTPLIRTITGACFGIFSGWIILPLVERMVNQPKDRNL